MITNPRALTLLATTTAIALWGGWALDGMTGFLVALGFASFMNFFTYWMADRMVLRLYHAEELTVDRAPHLFALTRTLSTYAGVAMPRLFRIPESAPNAMAVGPDSGHGTIAVTDGLLRLLDEREIEAVVAHQLGQIKVRSMVLMGAAASLAGTLSAALNISSFGMLLDTWEFHAGSDMFVLGALFSALLAPAMAVLTQLVLHRSREFEADAAAARDLGDATVLAGALKRIAAWNRQQPMAVHWPSTAHLFIHNPHGSAGFSELFRTRPSVEERVARLETLSTADSPRTA